MFKGWVPAWMRLGPNTVLMFVFFEVSQTDVSSGCTSTPSFPTATEARLVPLRSFVISPNFAARREAYDNLYVQVVGLTLHIHMNTMDVR